MDKMRKGSIASFTLGAILYGTFFAGLILVIYTNLDNPNMWAKLLIVLLGVIAISTLVYIIFRKQLWNFFIGFKPSEPLDEVGNIIQRIRDEKDSEALEHVKKLAIYWAATKARISLLQFSFILLTLVAGFSSMGVLYNQLSKMTEANKITQESLDELRKQNEYQRALDHVKRRTTLLNYLYDKQENNTPKHNARIRENALLEYLELEENIKKLNKRNAFLGNGIVIKSPNSDNQINLSKALLQGVDYYDHKLVNMRLDHINFENAILSHIDFNNSNLDYANFTNATLVEVNLTNTTMTHVSFYNAIASNVTWNLGEDFPVVCCNIHGVKGITDELRKTLLQTGGYVEESNLTKWNQCIKNVS